MTPWCCFELFMLIPVNKVTAGTVRAITKTHAPRYTLWSPEGIWRALSCVLFHCHDSLIIWKSGRCRVSLCGAHNQPPPWWEPVPALSSKHTFTHTHSACRGSVKREMIPLSCRLCGIYSPIKPAWQVCLMGCWGCCVLGCAFSCRLHLLLAKRSWGGAHSNKH